MFNHLFIYCWLLHFKHEAVQTTFKNSAPIGLRHNLLKTRKKKYTFTGDASSHHQKVCSLKGHPFFHSGNLYAWHISMYKKKFVFVKKCIHQWIQKKSCSFFIETHTTYIQHLHNVHMIYYYYLSRVISQYSIKILAHVLSSLYNHFLLSGGPNLQF